MSLAKCCHVLMCMVVIVLYGKMYSIRSANFSIQSAVRIDEVDAFYQGAFCDITHYKARVHHNHVKSIVGHHG